MPPGRDVQARDRIQRRIQDQEHLAARMGQFPEEPAAAGEPRWRVDARWVEFECGCRAERVSGFSCRLEPYDPIIFAGLPEMAVYDFVCHRHMAGMNKRVHFGHYITFEQWRRHRRHVLMNRSLTV